MVGVKRKITGIVNCGWEKGAMLIDPHEFQHFNGYVGVMESSVADQSLIKVDAILF